MKKLTLLLVIFAGLQIAGQPQVFGQSGQFNGLNMNMGNMFRLSDAKTRSISPENLTGAVGKGGMATLDTGSAHVAARDLGQGWKVNPYVHIQPGETFTMAEIDGSGAIQHIWMTPTGNWRNSIIRMYWDGEKTPSVEAPVGDFFCMGWGQYDQISSLAVCVNPGSAFNCYWTMPFRKHCRITMTNTDSKPMTLYYQVDYTLTEVPKDAGYFHAQFHRANPVKNGIDTLVANIKGKGQYVGTYMAVEVHSNGWWGEGEIKFYIDDDSQFPTICGTGTEDYFCGSYDFDSDQRMPDGRISREYTEFTTPYAGLPQVIKGDGHYNVMQRFGMYRWHITDPIRFEKGLTVTIQDLGWGTEGRYMVQQSDISSVVYWYQQEPHGEFPEMPSTTEREYNR